MCRCHRPTPISNRSTGTAPRSTSSATPRAIRRRIKAHGPLATRRDELACDDLKTVLSMREYRTGVLVTVIVWLRQDGPASLDEMCKALVEPHFVLFAGRKAFPLMLPCRPLLIAAETVDTALVDYDASRPDALVAFEAELLADRLPRRGSLPVLYADSDAALAGTTQRIETRRDEPETRAKWSFGLRTEHVVP